MAFRVQARTILQLGAELISSDAIAFYELIKNSFDARANRVRIRIFCAMPHRECNQYLDLLERESKAGKVSKSRVKDLQGEIEPHFTVEDQFSRSCLAEFQNAENLGEMISSLKKASRIEIEDGGSGMSLQDLEEVYLTIGTRQRYTERQSSLSSPESGDRVVLGEKGIGRLSVMRLGGELSIRTSKTNERKWNTLDIDWNAFSHDIDQYIENVPLAPRLGDLKEDASKSGTRLVVTRLTSTWTRQRVESMVSEQFTKFIDPFASESPYKVFVRFNDSAIPTPGFDSTLLQAAQASLSAEYITEGQDAPCLVGRINYHRHSRTKTFEDKGAHLLTSSKPGRLQSTTEQLKAVGPFKLHLYWFNRLYIRKNFGLEAPTILNLLRNWAGGVMVYRDGFRVNPYGEPDDDWLGLDRKAFASGGFKLNRTQIIGKLEISSRKNPVFLDQTNREGLRDCDEKETLVTILRHVILTHLKTFLNQVERELAPREPVSFEEVDSRAVKTSKDLKKVWKSLLDRYPQVKSNSELVSQVEEALEDLGETLDEARTLVASYKEGRDQLVHLAGVGLMVEVVGHELNRATEHALRSLALSKKAGSTDEFEAALQSLHAQLKTIQKRLKILDPLSTAGRQVKEEFDLISWTKDIFESHQEQFDRHNITPELIVKPKGTRKPLLVRAVKGMIVQILENLIANSVYWLAAERLLDRSFEPALRITIDSEEYKLLVTDNGPGVSATKVEDIFEPFMTSKPPGEGKGLGLYVARELARYHGCTLSMADKLGPKGNLNTFVFGFSKIVK